MTIALLLIDLQNDFLPSGALPVPDGDAVIPVINQLLSKFELVVATRDWHPASHGSFAANHPGRRPGEVIELNGLRQILWPVHCVQNTPGAEFAPRLDTSPIRQVFFKGTDPMVDSYSGFFDNGHRVCTGLDSFLRDQGVEQVYLAGLATDYCVQYTALDARQLGFETYVILDACRGVELQPGDVARAIQDMTQAGVHMIRSSNL